VCLLSSKDRYADVPDSVHAHAAVVTSSNDIPDGSVVVVATSHRLGATGERGRLLTRLGPGGNGEAPFDLLFVDEAWQLANYLFARVEKSAPLVVGVGDVGQLPPLETGSNPWRGDARYNPYRAWPTGHDGDARTWSAELPTVWRPAAEQLSLWRAFYPEWGELDCVAAPGDRATALDAMTGLAAAVWAEVATGRPLLLEVDGLDESEAPDVDLPLVTFAEELLDALFAAGFALRTARYDESGSPTGEIIEAAPGGNSDDPLVAFLATRNQAVDDAAEAVERLRETHGLTERDRRLLAGPDERDHGRDSPADRRDAARRVQLRLRPSGGDLHARHARTARPVAARPRRVPGRGAGPAGHVLRGAGKPAPATPDPPADSRHVHARQR
jgi:hypothetical protein